MANLYPTDLTDAAWALVSPLLPPARTGGRRRTTDLRAVLDAIFYLLRTGCQWRLLPRDFPAWGTVYPEVLATVKRKCLNNNHLRQNKSER